MDSLVWFFTLLLLVTESFSEETSIVEIPNGKLSGIFNNNFYEFRGIPYAEPPIGENRFEPPKPYTKKWEGIYYASNYSNVCMQWDQFLFKEDLLNGDEDCLYLNIFTPSVNGDTLYPVIVHIHGGAFMFGSGGFYEPNILMQEKKFVVVSLNYRLGPLGFLSTADSEISGNMGLKDQRLALQWIKTNIKLFKGDPEMITITGFSAGGASVHLQLLSKKSLGLFSRAISHSGAAFSAWVQVRNPLERAKKLAAHLKCPTDNTKDLKECLKHKSGEDIVRAVQIFQPYQYNPFMVFGPVVESKTSENAFITDDFETVIKSGETITTPWLISYTSGEGGYNAGSLMARDENNEEIINNFDKIWKDLAPLILFFNETVPKEKHSSHAEKLQRKYLCDEKFSVDTYLKVQKMFSDQLYLNGIEKAIKLQRDHSGTVYVYQYEKPMRYGNWASILSNNTEFDFGAVHGVDVCLIYETSYFPLADFNKEEKLIAQHFSNMYETFARDGTPVYGNIKLPENEPNSNEIKLLKIHDAEHYEVVTVDKIVDPLDADGHCVNNIQ